MSIQTELTRITNAKAAIKTAIEGKGVTVPDGTLLDGMAALIESIEAGRGAGFATGTLTFNNLQSTASDLTVTHNLGFVPDHILWFIIETEAKSSDKFYANNRPVSFEYISQEAYLTNCNINVGSNSSATNTFNYYIKTSGKALNIINNAGANEETIKLFFPHGSRTLSKIPASSTIRWIIW